MTVFIGLSDTARNYTLQFAITHILVPTVTSLQPLLLLIISSRHGPRRKRLFHRYCIFLLPWRHSCLRSRYLTMVDVNCLFSGRCRAMRLLATVFSKLLFILFKFLYTTTCFLSAIFKVILNILRINFIELDSAAVSQIWVRMSHYFLVGRLWS
jgi:hypothetical protein